MAIAEITEIRAILLLYSMCWPEHSSIMYIFHIPIGAQQFIKKHAKQDVPQKNIQANELCIISKA